MPTIKELEKWMSTGQVSKYLGISRQAVNYLATQRRLRGVKTAAGWLFDPADVENHRRQRVDRQ